MDKADRERIAELVDLLRFNKTTGRTVYPVESAVLDLWDALAAVEAEAARLRRNVRLRGKGVETLDGEWIAVPRQEFQELRRLVEAWLDVLLKRTQEGRT